VCFYVWWHGKNAVYFCNNTFFLKEVYDYIPNQKLICFQKKMARKSVAKSTIQSAPVEVKNEVAVVAAVVTTNNEAQSAKKRTARKPKSAEPAVVSSAPAHEPIVALSDVPQGGSVITAEYLGSDVEYSEATKKSPKRQVTYQTHMARYNDVIKLLELAVEKKRKNGEKGTRFFLKLAKNIREMQQEVPKVTKSMKKRNNAKPKVSGFSLRCNITPELAAFLKVDPNETFTRSEITNAVCAYINFKPTETRPSARRWSYLNDAGTGADGVVVPVRNLQDSEKKTKIIPDKTLSDLLAYDAYKRAVKNGEIKTKKINKATRHEEIFVQTDDSLAYKVVQKLIQRHFIHTNKVVASSSK
jgi:chromatin remodeling complex protein RSC6